MAIAHFLIPYEHFKITDKDAVWRRLPIAGDKDLLDQGYWSEAEIDGDQAIVRMRAPQAELKNLGTTYQALNYPETVWTQQRRIVEWNDGEPVFSEALMDSRPLESLTGDVFTDKEHSWFKDEVEDLMKKADKDGYARIEHPWSHASKLVAALGAKGYGLDRASTGTFPVNSTVLDNFDRADSTTTLGSSWTQDVLNSSWNSYGILSNLAYPAADFKSDYYNVASYGPDCEVYVTLSTITGGNAGIFARAINVVSSTLKMYEARHGSTDSYLMRWDNNGGATQLGANLFVAFANGDKHGFECIGPILTAYRFTGGAWVAAGARVDANLTAGGRTGLVTGSTATALRLNDYVAGNIGATPTFLRPASDISAGDYLPTPGSPTTLYDKLDETSFSDTDYASGTSSFEVKLA